MDHLEHLPADTAPDFNAVAPIQPREYRGNVTISGTDTTHWSVIVRDTQDGYGALFDDASSSETTFGF